MSRVSEVTRRGPVGWHGCGGWVGRGHQTLTFDPEDAAAVEGAAVSYAKLGQYAKADEKLERLLTLRPNDVEAVRLLVSSHVCSHVCSESTTRRGSTSCSVDAAGKAYRAVSYVDPRRSQAETKAQEGDLKGSATNYERALRLSPDSLELFRGYIVRARLCPQPRGSFRGERDPYGGVSLLTPKARGTGDTQTILTTDGKNAQAVAALLEAKPRAAARGNVGIEGSASDPIDDVQLQLLLGKVYSEWKGHRCDAGAAVECVEQQGVGGCT